MSRPIPFFHFLLKSHVSHSKFSAGASRRPRAPLLQFWHHEVTDCSAKTSVQNIEEPNQNHKGFQRDWWDRTRSVLLCFYNVFATFAKKCFHSSMEDFVDHISKFWVRVLCAHPNPNPSPPQMRSYSEHLVPNQFNEAFILMWDPGSSHLRQK